MPPPHVSTHTITDIAKRSWTLSYSVRIQLQNPSQHSISRSHYQYTIWPHDMKSKPLILQMKKIEPQRWVMASWCLRLRSRTSITKVPFPIALSHFSNSNVLWLFLGMGDGELALALSCIRKRDKGLLSRSEASKKAWRKRHIWAGLKKLAVFRNQCSIFSKKNFRIRKAPPVEGTALAKEQWELLCALRMLWAVEQSGSHNGGYGFFSAPWHWGRW